MKNTKHYIYKITNLLNNKIYIGQTINPIQRWSRHKWYSQKLERCAQYIHRSIFKYGIENFIFEIIAICKNKKDIDDIECAIIAQYNSCNKKFGYNIKPGGMTSGHSDETKEKLRKATTKRLKEKGHPCTGQKRTPEQVENIRKGILARDPGWCTPELRKIISDRQKGRKQSEEQIKKRSDAIKNKIGTMVCAVPDCGVIENRRCLVIDEIRYCYMHGQRVKSTGTTDLLPIEAYNKKHFSKEQITAILSDTRGAEKIGKDFSVSESVILRIIKEHPGQKIQYSHIGFEPPNKVKFTEEQINSILSDQKNFKEIAKDYNVGLGVIYRVFRSNPIVFNERKKRTKKWSDDKKSSLSETLKDGAKRLNTPEIRKKIAEIRKNKRKIRICGAANCGEIEYGKKSITINNIKYCQKHGWRLKKHGSLE